MQSFFEKKENLQPEECLLHEIKNNKHLVFGIPKENQETETRLPLTPEAVSILVEEGHEVLIESGAGLGMNYTDLRYAEAGATVVETAEDAFSADIVFKIAPPTPQEVALMNDRSALFSMLQLSLFSKESIALMMQKKIMAVAYELIKDEQRNFPVMSSISEIEGSTAISIAEIGRAHV